MQTAADPITITREAPDGPAARTCLNAYYTELAARFDGGFNPGAAGYGGGSAEERFLVAWMDGQPVGCGALVRVDAATAEIKRMWTAPAARGRGIARRLLAALEAEARAAGALVLRLDTNAALAEAQRFYASAGFRPVPRFNDNPYAHHWFAKPLD
jgi:GNAT superfamily N-acetyltransferase